MNVFNPTLYCMCAAGSCEYQGKVYGIGESWINTDCYQCICMEPFGVGCCEE